MAGQNLPIAQNNGAIGRGGHLGAEASCRAREICNPMSSLRLAAVRCCFARRMFCHLLQTASRHAKYSWGSPACRRWIARRNFGDQPWPSGLGDQEPLATERRAALLAIGGAPNSVTRPGITRSACRFAAYAAPRTRAHRRPEDREMSGAVSARCVIGAACGRERMHELFWTWLVQNDHVRLDLETSEDESVHPIADDVQAWGGSSAQPIQTIQ